MGRGIGIDQESTVRRASSLSISEVTVTKLVDAASVQLFAAMDNDTPRTVTIDVVSPESGRTYLTYVLHETWLSGLSTSCAPQARASEHLSLNFTRIEMRHVQGAYRREDKPSDTQSAHHQIRRC
jgi:type VI protein secretion system component Hcp